MGLVGAEWAEDKQNRMCSRRRGWSSGHGCGTPSLSTCLKGLDKEMLHRLTLTAEWQLVLLKVF